MIDSIHIKNNVDLAEGFALLGMIACLENDKNKEEIVLFLNRYSDPNKLPGGHFTPKEILEKCSSALIEFFGSPLSVILEIMPNSSHELNLVAWIQWTGGFDDGMERYSQFEDWYIENDLDLKSDLVDVTIEIVGE